VISFSGAEALDYASLVLPARIESLGGSAAARASGVGGMCLNPATLNDLKDLEWLFSTSQVFADYTSYGFNRGLRLGDRVTVIGVAMAGTEIAGLQRVEKIDDRPRVLYKDSSRRMLLAFGLARRWSEKLGWGLNLKYYKYSLFDAAANGLGLDAGLKYALLPELVLGASWRNLNDARLNWSTGSSDALARELQVGLAYEFQTFSCPIIFSLDNIFSADKISRLNYAAEFWLWPEILALRAGVAERLNLGLGFSLYGFSLDYAYAAHEDLGASHRISLGWAR
jgi:hypothetical protein